MIEYSEEVIEIIERAEQDEELTKAEKVVVEVTELVNLLNEDGLHDFWFSSLDVENTIKLLDGIGAIELIDLIQASQWCQNMSENKMDYTQVEEAHLAEIEEELPAKLADIAELLDEYLESEE